MNRSILQTFSHWLVIALIFASMIVVCAHPEIHGRPQHVLFALLITFLGLQTRSLLLAFVMILIAMIEETLRTLPAGTMIVACSIVGIVTISIMRITRLTWPWRGLLNCIAVAAVYSFFPRLSVTFKEQTWGELGNVLPGSGETMLLAGTSWFLMAVIVSGLENFSAKQPSQQIELDA